MTPDQFDMWKNADVPRSDVPHPLLIEPSVTEHYYTRSNEFKISDEMYLSPPCLLNAVLQSPMTPGQFDMWKNADVPRSDVTPPPLMEPSATEPYYTMSV